MSFFKSIITGSLLSASLIPFYVHAQKSDVAFEQDGWRYQITPYVWLANLDGKIRPFRQAPQVHVKRTRKDILSNLNAAAFLMGTARKNNFVMQGDITYASVSNTEKLPLGLKAKAETKQKAITLTAGQSLLNNNQHALDLLAGVRYWDIDAKVSVASLPLKYQSTSRFIDPIVGARYRYELTPRLSAIGYVDIGGFGVGSRLAWQAFGTLNYELAQNMYASIGYRHIAVDYRKSGRRLNINMSGPILGFSYQF